MIDKVCKYNPAQPADKVCFECGDGLCSVGSCGSSFDGHDFCNECFEKFQLEDKSDTREWMERTGRCWSCGELLEEIWENNGFDEPSGPSHWEVAGYKPCKCRWEAQND